MDNFVTEFNKLQKEAFLVSKEHGFQEHRSNKLYVATKLALIMSEVSEALEWDRQGKLDELPSELADIVIRTMDLAESLSINLAESIKEKHTINQTRVFKHGNKLY